MDGLDGTKARFRAAAQLYGGFPDKQRPRLTRQRDILCILCISFGSGVKHDIDPHSQGLTRLL